jgi:hypothetical protein
VKFRNWPGLEVKCENFRQFLDSERTGSHSDKEEESLRRFPLRLFNLSQSPLICFIKRLRQFVQNILNATWEAVGEIGKLTMDPSEPIGCMAEIDERDEV